MIGVIEDGTDDSYLDYYGGLIWWATPGDSHIYTKEKYLGQRHPFSFIWEKEKTDNSQKVFIGGYVSWPTPIDTQKRKDQTKISVSTPI
jgi:Tfp pilus assembly protein PilZ